MVSFEKHFYRRLAWLQQPNAPVLIGKKQLYEIARLKVNATDPNTTFSDFLKEQLDAKDEQSLLALTANDAALRQNAFAAACIGGR